MVEANKVESIEFGWGKKRGRGGKKKKVKFYESFTYDGVKYTLFDSVYLCKEDEPEPYIGKLIKIWEHPDKTKKVKVLWFFRPCEILNYLGPEETRENELILASGEGLGLTNINQLEAIAGKCNVVCISKDSRNSQPSDEELQKADFVFYRTFDVGNCTILDKIEEKIAGIEVEFIFNRAEPHEDSGPQKLDSNKEEVCGNAASGDRVISPKQNISKEGKTVKADGNYDDASAKENADMKASLGKQKSLHGEKPASGELTKLGEMTKTSDRKENNSNNKTPLNSKVDSGRSLADVGKVLVNQDKVKEKVKFSKDSGELDSRPSKKVKLDGSVKLSESKSKNHAHKISFDSDGNDANALVPALTAFGDESKLSKESQGKDKGPSDKLKPFEKITKLPNGELPKTSPRQSPNDDKKADCQIMEVTRKPDADRRKWFRGLPWDERMQIANEQGTLVLLQNLDPTYTSAEVEGIVWIGFKESCAAKMIQRTAISCPHSGQAFVIFKTREVAKKVVQKLDEGCLLLPNKSLSHRKVAAVQPPPQAFLAADLESRCDNGYRTGTWWPLVGSFGTPCFSGKQLTFYGHLSIDKHKLQMQREMKQAVSTSHCSQPNTLEYDMAMEWCSLQERSDCTWKKLYEQQGEQLRKLKAELKSN